MGHPHQNGFVFADKYGSVGLGKTMLGVGLSMPHPWNEQQAHIDYLEGEHDPHLQDEDYDPECYDFMPIEPSKAPDVLFNVDRWAAYTKQRLHNQGLFVKSVLQHYGPWTNTTPKQNRRLRKKMRKNNDTSITVHPIKKPHPYSVNYWDSSLKRELTKYFNSAKKSRAFIRKCDDSKGRYEVIEWYGFLYDANAPF